MSIIARENFEDYIDGQDINGASGGTGWTTPWFWDSAYGGNAGGWFASNVNPFEGLIDVQSAGNNSTLVRSFPLVAHGIFHATLLSEDVTSPPNIHFDLFQGTTFVGAYVISPDSGGIEYLYDGTQVEEQIAASTNDWREIEVEFDAVNRRIRLRRGGSTNPWSAWYTTGNAFTGVDTIDIIAGGPGGTTVRIDDISVVEQVEATEDFESYALGSINGGNGGVGWNGPWVAAGDERWNVTATDPISGTQSLIGASGFVDAGDKAKRPLNIFLDGSVYSTKFRITNHADNRWFLTLGAAFPDANNREVAQIAFLRDGFIYASGGNQLEAFTDGVDVKVDIRLDFTDKIYFVRINDTNTYGPFNFVNPESQVAGVFYQDGEDTLGSTMMIDDINLNVVFDATPTAITSNNEIFTISGVSASPLTGWGIYTPDGNQYDFQFSDNPTLSQSWADWGYDVPANAQFGADFGVWHFVWFDNTVNPGDVPTYPDALSNPGYLGVDVAVNYSGTLDQTFASDAIIDHETYPSDNFDSYSDGPIDGDDGGSGWDGPWSDPDGAYSVQSSIVHSSPHALKGTGDGVRHDLNRPFGTVDADDRVQTFYAYIDGNSSGNWDISLLKFGNPDVAAGVQFRSEDNTLRLISASDGGPWIVIQTFSPGQWYKIDLMLNFTDQTYRVQINDSGFTAPYQFWITSDLVDRFTVIGENPGVGNDLYLDDINDTTPIETTFQNDGFVEFFITLTGDAGFGEKNKGKK